MAPRLAAALALLALLPAGASASTVRLEATTDHGLRGERFAAHDLLYDAAAGERNTLRVTTRSGEAVVTDSVAIVPGEGCSPSESPTTVICRTPLLRVLRVALGDGDDRVEELPYAHLVADGGGGDDVIDARRANRVLLAGGPGDDELLGGAGGSWLDGGPGGDRMAGVVVDYATRTAPVHVTPDELPNDGEAGEGDDVRARTVRGGAGDDVLVAGAAGGGLVGGAGDDRLVGGAGDDSLIGDGGADALEGGAGDDRMYGWSSYETGGPSIPGVAGPPRPEPRPDGPNTLGGGGGEDWLTGGPAADALDPGPGRDLVVGRGGGDGIRARDGELDLITCGGFAGTAAIDPLDLARRCASVDREGTGFPQFLAIDQNDLDPDGSLRVVIGCSQDQVRACAARLRVKRGRRTLAARLVSVPAGAARELRLVLKPPPELPGCRPKRIAVSLTARDTAGRLRRVTREPTFGGLGVDCPPAGAAYAALRGW